MQVVYVLQTSLLYTYQCHKVPHSKHMSLVSVVSIFLKVSRRFFLWNAYRTCYNLHKMKYLYLSTTTCKCITTYFYIRPSCFIVTTDEDFSFDLFIFMLYSSLNVIFIVVRIFSKSSSLSVTTKISSVNRNNCTFSP